MSDEPEELMTPSEVAAMFRVDPKTVQRWAKSGQIPFVFTVGGHRRYVKSKMVEILRGRSSAM